MSRRSIGRGELRTRVVPLRARRRMRLGDGIGSTVLTIDDVVDVDYHAEHGFADLSWHAGASDEITLAFDRLDKWPTIVDMADADDRLYPDDPAWIRRTWVDLDGNALGRPPVEPFIPTRWVRRHPS